MRFFVKALVCLVFALSALAQQDVSQTEKPSREAVETRFYRDGSNNLEYRCDALGRQPTNSVWGRTAALSFQPNTPASVGVSATLTSIVVLTNIGTATTSAAHGLNVGQVFRVAGATVDPQLNSGADPYVIASVPNGTTFTFTTASVSNATYNESTLNISTYAPRTNAMIWAIRKFYYTSTYMDRDVPARGGGALNLSCDLRATYFQ